MARGDTDTYRLRPTLELFFVDGGDAYLLRGGSGPEHVIRAPSSHDRQLLSDLASGPVEVVAGTPTADRIAPLVDAGAVVRAPDLGRLTAEDAARFDRQLPYLQDLGDPVELQLKLRDSAVAIIGCGGLGTWALAALASAGVGRFVLIDDDRVSTSNLNRQILYGAGDVGAAKVRRAAAWVKRFDASIQVEERAARIREPADLDDLSWCDTWLLTADHPPYELARWVNAAALTHGVPYLIAGQQPPLVTIGPTFIPGRGACVECLEQAARRNFALYDQVAAQRASRATDATTLGPASALVGAVLSLEVMHLLLDGPVATHDRVLVVDIQTLDTTWTDIVRAQDCPACGT